MSYKWDNMPEFIQKKVDPYKKIKVVFLDGSSIFARFDNKTNYDTYKFRCIKYNFSEITAQRDLFSLVTEQKITGKTKSIWYPFKSHWEVLRKSILQKKESPLSTLFILFQKEDITMV